MPRASRYESAEDIGEPRTSRRRSNPIKSSKPIAAVSLRGELVLARQLHPPVALSSVVLSEHVVATSASLLVPQSCRPHAAHVSRQAFAQRALLEQPGQSKGLTLPRKLSKGVNWTSVPVCKRTGVESPSVKPKSPSDVQA